MTSLDFPNTSGGYAFRNTNHPNTGGAAYPLITPVSVSTSSYDWQRGSLDVRESKVGGTVVSHYDYSVNAIGQREEVATSGNAFAAGGSGGYLGWDYNDRGNQCTGLKVFTRSFIWLLGTIGIFTFASTSCSKKIKEGVLDLEDSKTVALYTL